MNKKILYWAIGGVVGVVVIGIFLAQPFRKNVAVTDVDMAGPKNATYEIDGKPVTLVDGVSVVAAAPGSAAKITTQYFGNEVTHDFDGDGRPDTAFILTQNTGGSGTFFYVVAALNKPSGFVGSKGFLLGDRIAPQTTEISRDLNKNVLIVNYADRKTGESFAVMPSVGKSVWLLLNVKTVQFEEID